MKISTIFVENSMYIFSLCQLFMEGKTFPKQFQLLKNFQWKISEISESKLLVLVNDEDGDPK